MLRWAFFPQPNTSVSRFSKNHVDALRLVELGFC